VKEVDKAYKAHLGEHKQDGKTIYLTNLVGRVNLIHRPYKNYDLLEENYIVPYFERCGERIEIAGVQMLIKSWDQKYTVIKNKHKHDMQV